MIRDRQPRISVITVTYEDPGGLSRTLESLYGLKTTGGHRVEVLVQDGGSGPETQQVLEEASSWAQVQSGGDCGIYDAMNRALARSSGEYVWFLNGGDICLLDDFDRLSVELPASDTLVFFNYRLNTGRTVLARRSRPGGYIRHALPTSHQAIAYPGGPARERGYDTSFEVASDYAFTASLMRDGLPWARSGVFLAEFATGGTSQRMSRHIAADAKRVQKEILGLSGASVVMSQAAHYLSRTARELVTR